MRNQWPIRAERPPSKSGPTNSTSCCPREVEEPFFRSLFRNIKELIHPPKLPPLEVTSQTRPSQGYLGILRRPGEARRTDLVSGSRCRRRLLFLLGTNKAVQQVVKQQIDLIAPDIAPYKPTVKKDAMHGGGGGGDRSPTPVSKGKLAEAGEQAVRASHDQATRTIPSW